MLDSPKRSALISACLHAGAIVLIVALTSVPNKVLTKHLTNRLFIPLDVSPYRPATPRPHPGGGGGQRDPLPTRYGQLPRFAAREFVAPTTHLPNSPAPIMIDPTLLAEPNANIQMIDLSKLGSPNGVYHGDSGGNGSGGGIGDFGKGGGVGDRNGPGYGSSQDAGGVATEGSGGRVTAPVLLWKTEPEYSEEARRAKIQGTVTLRIEIDAQGRPRNPRVLQRLGLGLDERALETVIRWRFRAAMRDGKPVASVATVEVNFRLL